MAKEKKQRKPLSSRGFERRIIVERYANATLQDLLRVENISELRKYYTDARSKALKQIARIQKSDVPFIDTPPEFAKTSELADDEIRRAVADINRFINSASYSIPGRREEYDELVSDLHEKGMDFITRSNLKEWDRFRKWVRATGLLNKPYTDGSILSEIFTQSVKSGSANSETWTKLYDEVKELLGAKQKRKRLYGSRKRSRRYGNKRK